MYLKISEEVGYTLKNFTFMIHRSDNGVGITHQVDCGFADNVNLEEVAEVINQSFTGDFEIITNETYNFAAYSISDFRLFVDADGADATVSFTKTV